MPRMSIRKKCEKNFNLIPSTPLPYNMIFGVFGHLTWNNADSDDYAEMRSILRDMIDAINRTEMYEVMRDEILEEFN